MAALIYARKAVWIVPIVALIAALMVAPAGAFLASAGHSAGGSAGTSVSSGAAAPSAASSYTYNPSVPFANAAPSPSSTFSPGAYSSSGSGAIGSSVSPSSPMASALSNVVSSIQSGRVPARAAYLPNYNLLAHPASSPSQIITPFYTASPAPMGIGDFGLGSLGLPYQYQTPSFDGQFTLNSYNATAGQLYEDTGGYYWNGLPATEASTPYQSGVQLNTVMTNVSIPGSTTAAFWTQNVLDFSGSSLQFIDNVWNFSGANLNPGTIYSGNGTFVPNVFYYDIGPTLPLAFPVTISLYNNASVVNGRTQVSFGYAISEPGQLFTGIYDTVVFNSITPASSADFLVNGYSTTPIGALYDSELVFTGPGAGSNAVINAVNGSMQLLQWNGASYAGVPSAYDYGGDTGETAVGVANTWSGTTENVTTGPSLLYGLWNTLAGAGSGSVHFTAHLTPTYAFVFIGRSIDQTYNYSWAPTDASGVVDTYLPTGLSYNYTVFADGYHQFPGITFTSSLSVNVAMTAAPAVLNAPLYMQSDAQASALAAAIGGNGTAPYTFANLAVAVNLTFNRLNDWGFPTFNLVQAWGFSTPIVVDNVYTAPNWNGITQWFQSPFGYTGDIPGLGQQFAVYDGTNDVFTNLVLPGTLIPAGVVQGGAISLWNDSGATATNLYSLDDSFGVWAAASPGTTVSDSVAAFGAVAFSVIASSGATGSNLTSGLGAASVFDEGGSAGSFSLLSAIEGSVGFYGFYANGTTIDQVSADYGSDGVFAQGGIGTTVTNVWANESQGVLGINMTDTAVTGAVGFNFTDPVVGFEGASGATIAQVTSNSSFGVDLYAFENATVTGVTALNGSLGFGSAYSDNLTVSGIAATGGSAGAEILGSTSVSVSDVTGVGVSPGVLIEDSVGITAQNLSFSGMSIGVAITTSQYVTVTGTNASGQSVGVLVEDASQISVDQTVASDLSVGVFLVSTQQCWVDGVVATNATISGPYDPGFVYTDLGLPAVAAVVTLDTAQSAVGNVAVTTYPAALYDLGSGTGLGGSVNANNINATGSYYAVILNQTLYGTLTNVSAYGDFVGVQLNGMADYNLITGGSFVADVSYGVEITFGEDNTVFNNAFVGDNGATTVYDPLHVQAWSYQYNAFDSSGVGNFWADWHTYTASGVLAPYYVSSGVWDYYPIGPYQYQMINVTFAETGLASGTNWSVNLNGVLESSTSSSITVPVPMGTYPYTVLSVAGYSATPSSGSVTVGPSAYVVSVTFSPRTYAVTVSEGGLASGTSWSATVNGVTQSTSGTYLVFEEPNGTYAYTLGSVGGYNLAGGTGQVVVNGQATSVAGSYSAKTALATSSDLNTYFGIAIAIAVVALLVGIVALLRRGGRRPSATPPPPEAWTPPAGTHAPPAGAGDGGASSGSATWNEGPEHPSS